jgi:CheY-like chemotaxis protein
LSIELPREPVWLSGDPVRLAQIVENLLHNAVKFTPPGGHIALTAAVVGNAVQIAVEDTGIGIASNELERVFELFAQAQHSADRVQDGLGIGLSLVRNLVQLHGGTIAASSAGVGRGSKFLIALPVLKDKPIDIAPPVRSAAQHGRKRGLRILLVDDSPDATQMLALLLRKLGHCVETAADGPAALATVRQFTPQVVLLDIGLPGMDGYEVAARLRQIPELSGAMLIALTGYGQERDRKLATAAGFDHHVVKPLKLDELTALLESAVDTAENSA